MELLVNEKMFYGLFIKLAILLFQCLLAISDERLPNYVKPEQYSLDLSIDLGGPPDDFWNLLVYLDARSIKEVRRPPTFSGSVEIQVACTVSTKEIVLHAENLVIDKNISVWNTETKSSIEAIGDSNSQGQYVIHLHEALTAELLYTIKLVFSNSPDSSVGLIMDQLSSEAYTRTDKDIARYIFPCFDQIDMKAKFHIILRHKERFNAFSMTDYTMTSVQDGWVKEVFQQLHPISTYSITFALTSSPCQRRVYHASPIAIGHCSGSHVGTLMEYVCENIANIFAFISRFLDMPYPLEKFYIICQFAEMSELTEGYGLLITGFDYLSSITRKISLHEQYAFKYEGIKRFCNVLSHQWFGHIVTMDWEESWFNDGLNIYIQWLCAAEVYKFDQSLQYPDYKWDTISSFLHIMKREETGDWISMPIGNSNWFSEPRSDDIKHRDFYFYHGLLMIFIRTEDCNEIMKLEEEIRLPTINSNIVEERNLTFMNALSTHLVRMVDFSMATKKFQLAIQEYLVEYKYKHTNLNQVWESLTKTAISYSPRMPFINNLNVENIMKNWINQNGHPLIIVERNYNNGEVRLRQEPFTVLVETEVEGNSLARERCWTIPFSYRTEYGDRSGTPVPYWFTCEDEESQNEDEESQNEDEESPKEDKESPNKLSLIYLPIENLDNNHWIIIDIEIDVLCRIHYDEDNWNLIKKYLLDNPMPNKITELNRLRLISDMFTLAKAGRLSYQIVFDTMLYLRLETSYAVWKVAIDELHEIRLLLLGSTLDIYQKFKEYMRRLLEPIFEEKKDTDYTFQQEYPSELNLSILIMEQSCMFGVESCIELGPQIIKRDLSLTSNGYSKIPYSINKAIHCQEVKIDDKRRDLLWEKYSTSKNTSRIELILMALGCSRSPEYLISYLESSLNSEIVSHDERLLIFRSVSLNFRGYSIMKDFFLSHYYELFSGTSESTGVSIIPYWQILLDATNRQDYLDELKEFALQHNVDFQSEWMQKSIANAKRNILWHRINANSVQEIISSFASCSGSICPMM